METKFTKGKWEIDKISNTQIDIRSNKQIDPICNVRLLLEEIFTPYPEEVEQLKANAKLIAAAPDLLEALIELKKFAGRCVDWLGDDPPIELVEKAIKKATE